MMANTMSLKEVIKEDYKKSLMDPLYFIRRHVWIQHPTEGRMLFDLYPYQEQAILDLMANKNTIVLKARQLGLSTAIAAYSLWLTTFHKDKTVLVIATKQETAKNLISKVRFAYDLLPRYLRTKESENNKLNIKFVNGSQVKAVTSTTDAARSEAVSLLILDEAAFIDNAHDLWTAAQATLSTGGKSALMSTPNGMGNLFHEIWCGAEDGTNDFHAIKLTWRDHPDRTEEWAEEQLRQLGKRGFAQEHEAEFLGSGNTAFPIESIIFQKEHNVKDPIQRGGPGGDFWVWKEPEYGLKQYLVTADVARGDGSDYSAFHVLDVETCEQAAEYRGKLDTTEFGYFLVSVATTYNDALLIVENANHGWAVIQAIINRGYRNLFYMSDDVRVVEEHMQITNKWNNYEKKKIPGFTTSPRTRPLIISKLDEFLKVGLGANEEIIQEPAITIHSERTIRELNTFIWVNGKPQAASGYNDDLVMSLCIGLWVRDTSMKIFEKNAEYTKAMIENMTKTSAPAIYTTTQTQPDPYTMDVGLARSNIHSSSEKEDLRWLLG